MHAHSSTFFSEMVTASKQSHSHMISITILIYYIVWNIQKITSHYDVINDKDPFEVPLGPHWNSNLGH